MLTEEQIKSLKPGDPLIIQGTYVRKHTDGDIVIKCNMTRGGFLDNDNKYFHPSCVSLPPKPTLPTLKYDPNRPYKKGDIVKRRTVDGRTDPDVPEGVHLTVTTSEAKYGNVRVLDPRGRSIVTKAVFLELITPVEELAPYTIECCISGKGTDYRIKKDGVIICAYSCAHPNGEAAAKAERERLNAEWRKEQAHD